MATTADTKSDNKRRFKVLGTSKIRQDGMDKVTGRAKFGADVQMAGLLHAKMLRSPHPHAIIRSIDTSAAGALPGVKAVVTAQDLPIIEREAPDLSQARSTARSMAENDLADKKVFYKGHAVAAVELIKVDYEVLPAVLNVLDAMKDDASVLHENLTTMFRTENFARGDDTGVKGNIAGHVQIVQGDVEQGFRQADVIVERELTTTMVHQG